MLPNTKTQYILHTSIAGPYGVQIFTNKKKAIKAYRTATAIPSYIHSHKFREATLVKVVTTTQQILPEVFTYE